MAWIFFEIFYSYNSIEKPESKTVIRMVKEKNWVKLKIITQEWYYSADCIAKNPMWYFGQKIIEKHHGKIWLRKLSEEEIEIVITVPIYQSKLSTYEQFGFS